MLGYPTILCFQAIVTLETFFTISLKGPVMKRMIEFIKAEDGPTATEYAVMLALIIVVAITAITVLGNKVSQTFSNVHTHI